MIKRPNTKAQRVRRHQRVRGKVSGTAERPRLSVFRSENNIYAQVHYAPLHLMPYYQQWGK